MSESPLLGELPPALAKALADRGYGELTSIQAAVLAPELEGRDLRITSQTGSGKTVALGLVLASLVEGKRGPSRVAKPSVLVVTPTRELAQQVGRELTWLFAELRARVVTVTGGTSVVLDRRALESNPSVVVGTPGRIADHLRTGAIDLGALRALALDEADEMLDMGFREELDAIVAASPADRRTHLVSATFSGEVLALAERLQKDPVHVQGTRLGAANADIEHRAVVVRASDKADALVNILLLGPNERTLVFTRTRAGAAQVSVGLNELGFHTRALHGEMTQRERNETLESFRRGHTAILVATDVAARGLDVEGVTRVVQFDLPENVEVFTHRSGRTGRAGRRGVNWTLVPQSAERRTAQLLREAKVEVSWVAPPSPDEIHAASGDILVGEVEEALNDEVDPRLAELADRLLEAHDPKSLVLHLLAKSAYGLPCEPRHIAPVAAPRKLGSERGPRATREDRPRDDSRYAAFQMSWGRLRGAETKRVLALVCRRGGIEGRDVGRIQIGPHSSRVEVIEEKAAAFERAASRPDPREPHIRIRRWVDKAPPALERTAPRHARRG
ncbi:MAG: DEAD/DEAH box helicase [Myxococcales bacterium]|nr:DEAD/DEAH box helicase [Myxococcales bacterium]